MGARWPIRRFDRRMTTPAATLAVLPSAPSLAARQLLAGALAVALGDGLEAVLFFGWRGYSPQRIFQSVASGVLGEAAFDGGWPAAVLGLGLHICVATGIVLTYAVVARYWPLLRRQWLACGALYGVIAFLVMNRVVIPLSAVPPRPWPPSLPVLLNGIIGHVLVVGPPAAYFVYRALGPGDPRRGVHPR